MNLDAVPVLGLLIAFPALAAVAVALSPRRHAVAVARIAAAVELLGALGALLRFDPAVAGPQLVERAPWLPTIGAEWHVGLDATGAVFVPLTAALGLLVLLADTARRPPLHLALLLLFEASLVGVYTALDGVLFFGFWEATLGPLLFAGLLAGPRADAAAGRATIALLVGGSAMLVGLLIIIDAAGTADLGAIAAAPPPLAVQRVALPLIVLGLAVKAPLWPLHGWMPRLIAAGPLGVGLLVVGLKMGVWGLLRVAMPLCPEAFAEAAPILMALGLFSAVWAGLVALRQRGLRRLVAWLSVGHAGLVFAGVASGTAEAIDGALFDLVMVGAVSTALLLLADRIEQRFGVGDVAAVSGLARAAPRLAAAVAFFTLAALGLPTTGGFVGELLIFTGLGARHPLALAVAVLTVPLFAVAAGRTLRDLLGGAPSARVAAASAELSRGDGRLIAALALATVLPGLVPGPLLHHVRSDAAAPAVETSAVAAPR